MQTYSLQDIEKLLRLSGSVVRRMATEGFVRPTKGPRGKLLFSFQDLIVLRAARGLIDANVPSRRITRSLQRLRKHLPQEMPLSGFSVFAIGDEVVVRDGPGQWQAEDGQYVLAFDVAVRDDNLAVIERKPAITAPDDTADRLFDQALDIESSDPDSAIRLYAAACDANPDHVSSWINWGCLLHDRNELRQAIGIYRRGLKHSDDATLHFNLAVALDDDQNASAATDHYLRALELDPELVDAHYNLARLYEAAGEMQRAIRHYGQFKRARAAIE